MQNEELYNQCVERSKIKLKKYLFDPSSTELFPNSILSTKGSTAKPKYKIKAHSKFNTSTCAVDTSLNLILENLVGEEKQSNLEKQSSNSDTVASNTVAIPSNQILEKIKYTNEPEFINYTQQSENSSTSSLAPIHTPPSPVAENYKYTVKLAPKNSTQLSLNLSKETPDSAAKPSNSIHDKAELKSEITYNHYIQSNLAFRKATHTSMYRPQSPVEERHESTDKEKSKNKAQKPISSSKVVIGIGVEKAELVANVKSRNQHRSNPSKSITASTVISRNIKSDKIEPSTNSKDSALPRSSRSKIKFYDLSPVPDLLNHKMKILFINHNPDVFSSKKSRHFGNPANVFWDLLFKSGLISTELTCKDDKKLLEEYGFGFTYLCSRPTEWITELSKEELTEGVPILRQKIIDYKPQICCFLGLTTYKYFTGKPSIQRKTGFQTVTDAKLLDCKIFVTKSLNKLSTGCNYEEKLNQMKMLKKSIIMKY